MWFCQTPDAPDAVMTTPSCIVAPDFAVVEQPAIAINKQVIKLGMKVFIIALKLIIAVRN
jgi:hypothetical protein